MIQNGTLRLDSARGKWRMDAPAHVLMKARRVFSKVGNSQGYLELSDTQENARDLEWFLQRYPMKVDPYEYLRTRSISRKIQEHKVRQIVNLKAEVPELHDLAVPLRDYQKISVNLVLTNKSLLLADDLGTGKTASAIGVLTEKSALPALVVTMTHLPQQWEREINRFMPTLRTHIVTKGSYYDLTMSQGRVRSRTPRPFPDVVIMNYHKLAGWAEHLAPFIKFVVFDECQELRSGYGRDIPKKYTAAKYLAENSDYRLGLSATPIFNYGGEFFAVIDALHPDALGTYDEFQKEWCSASWGDKPKITDPQAFGTHLLSAGMMLRRTRKDVGRELPQLQRIPHHVDCNPEELDKVEKAVSDFAKIILGSAKEEFKGQKRNAHEQFSIRLRQATGIAKAPHVAAFVKMVVESGEKVVVFGWHREFWAVLQEQLKEYCPLLYTGTESAAEKEKNKRAFIAGDCKVLLISLRSGAGLDGLQHVARTCVFGELDWSPGVHEQCIGRLHRDGQQQPVVAYYLLAEAGSDPIVADILGLKTQQLEGVINPDAEIVEEVEVDMGIIKRMAQAYLDGKRP